LPGVPIEIEVMRQDARRLHRVGLAPAASLQVGDKTLDRRVYSDENRPRRQAIRSTWVLHCTNDGVAASRAPNVDHP
jgi:hypothetical protein